MISREKTALYTSSSSQLAALRLAGIAPSGCSDIDLWYAVTAHGRSLADGECGSCKELLRFTPEAESKG